MRAVTARHFGDVWGTIGRMSLSPDHPLRDGRTADSPLITAFRGTRPEHRPVWFMRQAGRSLPEYRKLRAGYDDAVAAL